VAAILLVGRDWRARALLRAQLIEEGLDVEAHEYVHEALARLHSTPHLPALLLADLTASDDPAADLEQLALWSNRVPTWIMASRSFSPALSGGRFERILFRPVDVGALVEQIKQRLTK
jgi:CheY-like chemotaxis protein